MMEESEFESTVLGCWQSSSSAAMPKVHVAIRDHHAPTVDACGSKIRALEEVGVARFDHGLREHPLANGCDPEAVQIPSHPFHCRFNFQSDVIMA